LFPKFSEEIKSPVTSQELTLFNRQLNDRQKIAVKNIVNGSHSPYIVFGPPGTGKTNTVVECVLQLWKNRPECCILIATPSNNAADLIVDRLHRHITNREMFRLMAYQRHKDSVSPSVLEYCHYDSRVGAFDLLPIKQLLHYRIIVATCITAGLLYSAGTPDTHFSHVFIDEAGQSEEPETLVSLAGLITKNTSVTLVGDPKQLGAVVRSPLALKYGLDKSLLERLVGENIYERDKKTGQYNNRCITKLTQNYRSHPDILIPASILFYDSELIASADVAMRESLVGWEELPNKKFPIIFHGVIGKDEREQHSPSWFNTVEATTIIKYIEKLKQYRTSPINNKEIGIITPYRKQVLKLRQLLRVKQLEGVTVGSVEEFQGQERRIILISTVRSSDDMLDFDYKHHLGFLKNPKRFNVAITRAQALLIVVGNPYVLSGDKYWGTLLNYCLDNSAYTGVPFSKNKIQKDQENIITFLNTNIKASEDLDDLGEGDHFFNPSMVHDSTFKYVDKI